jgi:hypothetical protein
MSERRHVSAAAAQSEPRRIQRIGVTALLLVAAVAFGGLDQYMGSRYLQFATAVSGMSAPWLLLPFAVGALQAYRRRAAWLGLACTWLAVAAYVLMIDSPVEGVHMTLRIVAITAQSQWLWFLGGLVTGPLYALLGYQWRAHRSWLSAGLAAIPLLFEPVISRLGLRPSFYSPAGYAEAAAGLALAGIFAFFIIRSRAAIREPETGTSA